MGKAFLIDVPEIYFEPLDFIISLKHNNGAESVCHCKNIKEIKKHYITDEGEKNDKTAR